MANSKENETATEATEKKETDNIAAAPTENVTSEVEVDTEVPKMVLDEHKKDKTNADKTVLVKSEKVKENVEAKKDEKSSEEVVTIIEAGPVKTDEVKVNINKDNNEHTEDTDTAGEDLLNLDAELVNIEKGEKDATSTEKEEVPILVEQTKNDDGNKETKAIEKEVVEVPEKSKTVQSEKDDEKTEKEIIPVSNELANTEKVLVEAKTDAKHSEQVENPDKDENNVKNKNAEKAVDENDTEQSDPEKVSEEPTVIENPVQKVLNKLQADKSVSDSDKIDTLCCLVVSVNEENRMLKTEMGYLNEQFEKNTQAKNALRQLNEAYKKQVNLVREESGIRIQEEHAKRAECVTGYQNTMTELSDLLETHTSQNTRLRDENVEMSSKLTTLIEEGEKREKDVANFLKGYQLQIELLEHQVSKANIEKAEIKADMTKERLELMQEFSKEQERISHMEERERLLKEQAMVYQGQLEGLQAGAGNTSKSFHHFKAQIESLTGQLNTLEKDTQQWRQKYEISSNQVKKMNASSLEREKELANLKKKLETMVKLNKTLSLERTNLMEKIKEMGGETNDKEKDEKKK